MPPVKKDKPEEVASNPVNPVATDTELAAYKGTTALIDEFNKSLLRLGIDLATGMHDKTRFPSAQEVAGIESLCKLYNAIRGK